MTSDASETTYTITVTDRDSRDRQINEAEALLRERAMQEQRGGILVTRRGAATFTLSLSEDVPFGFTREHQAW